MNSTIIENRKNRQTQLVLPFIEQFISKCNLNIDISKSIIGTTINNIQSDIYVRLEAHDKYNIKSQLYIDVIDVKDNYIISDYYYHITWAALTFSLRDCNYNILLRPLKDIYNKKTKFCDFMFRNRTYKNAVKRYNFYKILNKEKMTDDIQNDKRFSLEMYNDAVIQHRPYRFSIAFENDIVDGYVTEKIVNSFLAGCIPIYDGTEDVYKYFNKESFINARDFSSLKELVNYVIKVDNTPELYNKYINACPLDEDKLKKLFWWDNI